MPQVVAYLSFDGNCADAMRFYERALKGKLEVLMSVGDSPMASQSPPEAANRIMHARLTLDGGAMIFGGDCMAGQNYEGIKGLSMTLNYDTVEQAQRAFAALGEGGKVSMPMGPAFWAKSFGMLTDQFGTPWIVNGELLPV
ncbi:VOC family protein [soil metagenome]